jgi:hypothetical protein
MNPCKSIILYDFVFESAVRRYDYIGPTVWMLSSLGLKETRGYQVYTSQQERPKELIGFADITRLSHLYAPVLRCRVSLLPFSSSRNLANMTC